MWSPRFDQKGGGSGVQVRPAAGDSGQWRGRSAEEETNIRRSRTVRRADGRSSGAASVTDSGRSGTRGAVANGMM